MTSCSLVIIHVWRKLAAGFSPETLGNTKLFITTTRLVRAFEEKKNLQENNGSCDRSSSRWEAPHTLHPSSDSRETDETCGINSYRIFVERSMSRWEHLPICLSVYISMALQPFVGPLPLFQVLDFYKVGKTPLTGDQQVARPLPAHRTAQIDFSIDLILPAALWSWGRLSL
jgi:hypothetical protein